MRLDINYKKKKNCKNTNTWRLNNMYLENNWLLKKSKGKSKNFQKKMTKHDNSKPMGCSKSSSRREYNPTSSNKKKHHLDSLTLCLKQLEKEQKKSPNQQKEIDHKDQNRKKHKRYETIVKVNKAKSWFFEKINKTDKPLARLIKKREESNQQNQK